MRESSVNILIVDDRDDKLLALEAVLEELGQNLVKAQSGREALRHLLRQEFAVVLLDVNMPGMDGFETAQLIRQRQQCSDVPIIFLTAMGDDFHQSRSYSLGAVDYILTPVVPTILRSKVSVFVDLFRKNQQVRLQAEHLRQKAAQLHQLTTASLEINSASSVDRIVEIVTQTARQIVGTNQAMMLIASGVDAVHKDRFASVVPAKNNGHRHMSSGAELALVEMLNNATQPVRMTAVDLETKFPAPCGFQDCPPLHGLLAVPLMGRGGNRLGTLLLSDKVESDLTDDDQAILTQLGQMATVAMENVIFAAEREDARLKETFLSTVSHELRTPLSAMSGWIQLLRDEPVSSEVAHGLEVIERNVKVQAKVIEDLLDLSSISTGKLKIKARALHLRQPLNAAVEALKPMIMECQLKLDVQLGESNPSVMGDPDRLQQVFWNLLNNAAKFTPPGGTITVQLQSGGGLCKIVVKDTGEGIDHEFLPHVFQRFRQADGSITRRHGGLGIGLAVVKHLVELHGGAVSAESAGKGRGAMFTITLTEIAEAIDGALRSPDGAALKRDGALEGLQVLLVDDHPDAREVLSAILRRHRASVMSAASVAEAIQSLAHTRPQILVTDLGMPEQDGYSLLRHLRSLPAEQGGQIPAIAVTARASQQEREKALAAGFQAHVAKPVDPDELVEAVNRLRQPEPFPATATPVG